MTLHPRGEGEGGVMTLHPRGRCYGLVPGEGGVMVWSQGRGREGGVMTLHPGGEVL